MVMMMAVSASDGRLGQLFVSRSKSSGRIRLLSSFFAHHHSSDAVRDPSAARFSVLEYEVSEQTDWRRWMGEST